MVMRLHGRKPRVKAVSQLIATIILIAIVLIGGLFAFAIWNNFANIEAQKTQVNFEYLALYKGLGEPKAVFAATLKNTGSKPIKSLVIKLHNESAYQIPSVTELSPLAPGKSTGVTLTPPLIHADWYVVGMSYTVTVFGVAVDGSAFSHTASVMCMGQESRRVISEGAVYTVTFFVLDDESAAVQGATVVFAGLSYDHGSSIDITSGSYPLSAGVVPSGYEFDRWEVSEGVSVPDPLSPSTTAAVSGDGSITMRLKRVTAVTELAEGDYLGWEEKWSTSNTGGAIPSKGWDVHIYATVIDESGYVYVYFDAYDEGDIYTYAVYSIADGALLTTGFARLPGTYDLSSVGGKYYLTLAADKRHIEVRYGSRLLRTVELRAPYSDCTLAQWAMSASGKYVAVAEVQDRAFMLRLYEGIDSGAQPRPVVEGDYSGWNEKWSTGFSNTNPSSVDRIVIDDGGGYLYVEFSNTYVVYDLGNGTVVGSGSISSPLDEFRIHSVRGKYHLTEDASGTVVQVGHGDQTLRSIPMVNYDSRSGWAISSSGKYIAVVDFSSVNTGVVRVYEGVETGNPPTTVTEGGYFSWAEKWVTADTGGVDLWMKQIKYIIIDESGYVYVRLSSAYLVYDLDTGDLIASDQAGNSKRSYNSHSAVGKYQITMDGSTGDIVVNYACQRFVIDNGQYEALTVSASGRYVAVAQVPIVVIAGSVAATSVSRDSFILKVFDAGGPKEGVYYSFEEEMVYEGEGDVYAMLETICTFNEPTYVYRLEFYVLAYSQWDAYLPMLQIFVDGVKRYSLFPTMDGYALLNSSRVWLKVSYPIGKCTSIAFYGTTDNPFSFRDVSVIKRFVVREGFALVPQSNELTVVASRLTGGSASLGVEVKALDNAPGSVSLSASAPSGVSVTFSPAAGQPPFTSTATVAVGSDVVPGIYKVWLRASGGQYAFNMPITLKVVRGSSRQVSTPARAGSFDPYQQSMFLGYNMLWIFWGSNYGIRYVTYSLSSNTFGKVRDLVTGFGVEKLSLCYGKMLHIAMYDGYNLWYICGSPRSDGTVQWSSDHILPRPAGTIQWLSAEDAILKTILRKADLETISITVDWYGCPWVSYTYFRALLPFWERDGFGILKSKYSFMWETDPAANLTIENRGCEPFGTIIPLRPLSDGRMLAVYTYGSTMYARVWDGAAWLPETSLLAFDCFAEGPAFAVDEDYAYLFAVDGDGLYLIRFSRASNDFYDRVLICSLEKPFASSVPVVAQDPWTDDVYALWTSGGFIWHMWYEEESGALSVRETPTWKDEFGNGGVICLTVLPVPLRDKLYIAYISPDGSVKLLS